MVGRALPLLSHLFGLRPWEIESLFLDELVGYVKYAEDWRRNQRQE